MSDQDPREVITVTHPEIDVAATVTRKQFDRLYADRGWVEDADTDKPMASNSLTRPPRFERADRAPRGAWPPRTTAAVRSGRTRRAEPTSGDEAKE